LPSAVNAPAIGLLAVSAIWLLMLVMILAANLYIAARGIAQPTPAPRVMSETAMTIVQIALEASMLAVNGIIFFSGLTMRQLKNYQLARIGAALAIIPCLGPCYILGIPFGIWALVVLHKPGVKELFKS